MSKKSLFKSAVAVILAALFLAMAGCGPDPFYIDVAFIEGVPQTGEAGTPLALTGTVRPAFASNKDIVWSVKNTGTTGAVISGNILNTNAVGVVTIRAIIANGIAKGKDYTQDFIIVIGNGVPPITKEDEYTIVILMLDNESGDTVTVSPDKGTATDTVTLSYTVTDLKMNNQLYFGGVTEDIASVLEAGTGTRTYTINAADASNGVITITTIFTHTDLEIDHIAFSEHDGGHITKNDGDAPFTNAITAGHKGTGLITYHSSNESVATVDNTGTVTIHAVGSTVISAEKAADTQYAHAITTYTLTVNYKPGSEENPFLVANEADLRKVGTGADGWTLSAHYRQTADIAMTTSNFTPIGDNDNRFSGVYDGDGYAITNLTVTGTTNRLGLFGVIGETGTVKNMNVTGTITQNGTQVIGGIAGANSGTIDNCSFSGTVTGSSSADQVGGITGYNYGTVINSRNTATVSGKNAIGGITGVNQGKLENSYNTGSVTGSQQVGGIAGVNTNSDNTNYLKNCYNTGNVTAAAASNSHAGGIVGLNQLNAKVDYCYNTGNVTGSSAVGGIVGTNDNSSTATFCVSLGAKVTGSSSVGRVAGTFPGLGNNKARADMKIGASGSEAVPTTNIGGGALNGANFGLGAASTSTVTDGWDTSIWNAVSGNLNIGDNLPTLKPNTQIPAPTLPAAYSPLGTADNPFLVTNEADLRKVGSGTDGWTLSAHYRQTANIVLTSNFTKIGNDTNKFTGSYDGDGHTVKGLTMYPGSSYSGLFGYIGASGTVKNMDVTGTITQTGSGYVSTGGIAGQNDGTIDNCVFRGSVITGSTSDQVGGIAGQNNGTVINSRSYTTVSGKNQVGGIAGTNQGKIENCYNSDSDGASTDRTVTGNQQVGGIAGTNVGSGNYIKNSYNTANVTSNASSNNNVGGITGFNQQSALVEYCYNTGVITTSGGYGIGGIAGNSENGTIVRNCVSLSVRLVGTGNIGRIVGNNGSTSLSGNVARELMYLGASGSTTTATGGTATNPNGSSVSLGVSQQSSVFAGWNYSTIWNISGNLNVGADLPTLKDNMQSPAPTLPGDNPVLGTAANPFLVANETDLRKVGTGTDGWTLSAHYKQTANITMTGSSFTPIGTTATQFTGTYDGDGKSITNLTITGTATSYTGLFGFIGATGTVKNMNVSGTLTQGAYIGGIAGVNDGTIDNCSFSGTVNGGTTNDDVGGIAGRNNNNGTVINSRNTATVSGKNSIGGIAGSNYGKIETSYNTGAVSGNQQVGGIAGVNNTSGAYVKNSYNTGDVTGNTASGANTGGIVGNNQALVEYCYNTGNISGGSVVGGIVGNNGTAAGTTVQNCVSLGARVTCPGVIGRIAGGNNGTLGNNIARSDMKIGASGAEAAVSPAGDNSPNGSTVMVGASLSIVFKVSDGWDASIWNVSGSLAIGNALPTLKTNTQSPAPTLPAAYSPLGSADNPFLVTNEAELRKVGTGTDGWTLSAHYKQTANINMTTNNWVVLGAFKGTYNGNGFTVSGFTLNHPTTDYRGMFENIDLSGIVSNLGMVNVNIKGQNYVGGISGGNEGKIENCYVTGIISGNNQVGGITGMNRGKIDNSYNTGAVSGNQSVGGIAGVNTGSGNYIKNSYNTGDITATATTSNVGGIVGSCLTSSVVEYCYNTGIVTGANLVGGIAGTGDISVTVRYCVSLGARATATNNIGRIIGTTANLTLTNNKARADMKIGASGAEAVPTTNIGATERNGESVTVGSSTTQTTVFSGWDIGGWNTSTIWTLNATLLLSGSDLPTLKPNTQSPAPTLPAAYSPLGSAENPYLVTNEADLRRVGRPTATDGWPLTAHYKQTANIAMTGGNFMPIGNITDKFIGSYDGGGYTITGFSQVTSSNNVGFFGYIGSGGTLKNMNVTGTVTNNGSSASYIGGIAGQNDGTIDNCSFSGTVNGGTNNNEAGGIVGKNNGVVINSRSAATVSGKTGIGGIAGSNYGKTENSYNTGSVTGVNMVGGVAGINSGSSNYVKNCYNTGDITGTSSSVGGIVGSNQSGAPVEYCYNTGNITTGSNDGSTAGTGGIVGNNNSGSTVRYCVSLGARVTGSSIVGRVAGINDGTLSTNSAREDMKIGASGSEATVNTGTNYNKDGSPQFSVTAGLPLTSIFSGLDTAIWNISGSLTVGGNLATLKTNTQSPAPTLPATYYVLGSAENPFLVTTEADLRKVGTETAAGGWTVSAHYKQTANITVTSTAFTPIGSSANKFTGSYDGNFYTIEGVNITSTSNSYTGLFAYIGESGVVKNMTLTVTLSQSGNQSTGGIAGANQGRIENCSVSGSVNGGTACDQVGGIAGYNFPTGTIIYSRNRAGVTGRTMIGGIAGTNNGIIEQSYNTGAVIENNQRAGGIAGVNSGTGSIIKNCYNTAAVIGQSFPGGITGSNESNAVVEYCYNTGTVTGTAGGGGIAGRNATGGTIRYCGSFSTTVRTANSAAIGRITAGSTGSTLTANKARSDMKVGITGSEYLATTGVSANDIDGENITVGGAIATAFNYFSTSIWNITGMMTVGGAMPTLKENPQSPAPTLPAALP